MLGSKRGFTAIEAVIVIAVVAIIGGIAWYTISNKTSADSLLIGSVATTTKQLVAGESIKFSKVGVVNVTCPNGSAGFTSSNFMATGTVSQRGNVSNGSDSRNSDVIVTGKYKTGSGARKLNRGKIITLYRGDMSATLQKNSSFCRVSIWGVGKLNIKATTGTINVEYATKDAVLEQTTPAILTPVTLTINTTKPVCTDTITVSGVSDAKGNVSEALATVNSTASVAYDKQTIVVFDTYNVSATSSLTGQKASLRVDKEKGNTLNIAQGCDGSLSVSQTK